MIPRKIGAWPSFGPIRYAGSGGCWRITKDNCSTQCFPARLRIGRQRPDGGPLPGRLGGTVACSPLTALGVEPWKAAGEEAYVRDSEIAHALLGIGDREQLLGHPAAGPSWKSVVLSHAGGRRDDLPLELGRGGVMGSGNEAVDQQPATAQRISSCVRRLESGEANGDLSGPGARSRNGGGIRALSRRLTSSGVAGS